MVAGIGVAVATPAWATAVDVGAGVTLAQTQLVFDKQDGFLHTPPLHVIDIGQSELVEQDVPHCAAEVAVGVGVLVGAVVAALIVKLP